MKTRRVFSPRRYRYLGSKNLLRCDICDGDSCMVSHGGTAYHRCTEPVEVPRYLWHVTYRLSGRDRAIRKFGLLRSKPLKESFYRYKHQGSSIGYLEDIHLTEADESKLSKAKPCLKVMSMPISQSMTFFPYTPSIWTPVWILFEQGRLPCGELMPMHWDFRGTLTLILNEEKSGFMGIHFVHRTTSQTPPWNCLSLEICMLRPSSVDSRKSI